MKARILLFSLNIQEQNHHQKTELKREREVKNLDGDGGRETGVIVISIAVKAIVIDENDDVIVYFFGDAFRPRTRQVQPYATRRWHHQRRRH